MTTLDQARVSNISPTSEEMMMFQHLLGQTTCTTSPIARGVELFALAFSATAVYIFFQIPAVIQWFERYIPDPIYRFSVKTLLFFTAVYILDRLIIYLRAEIDICEFGLF